MIVYVIRRLISTVVVLFGVSLLSFLILQLVPGDPVQIMLGQTGASASDMERLRHELGLDQPMWVQYWNFLGHALHGDFGTSIVNHQAVSQLILDQMPATLQLTAAGMGIAIIAGVVAGIFAAIKPNSGVDLTVMAAAALGVAIPNFWLALLLIFFFAVDLQWLPAAGSAGPDHLILPAVTLAFGAAAIIARLTRSNMIEIFHQNYIVTARAKGVHRRTVVAKHALKNALIPIITVVGLQFGALLSGAVIIETVFGRQGIGRLAVTAILNKDYPLVQGTIMVTATAYVLVNLVVDLLYMVVDPRVSHE